MSRPRCGRAEWAPGMPPVCWEEVCSCCLEGGWGVGGGWYLISHCAINNNEQWETAVNRRRAGGLAGRGQGSAGAMQMSSSQILR